MNLNKHLNKLKIQRLSIDANFHDQLSAYEKFRIMSIGAHIECLFFAEGFEDLYIPDCNFIYLPIYSTPKINEIDLPIIEQYEEKVSIYLYFNHLTFFNATDTDSRARIILDMVQDGLNRLHIKYSLDPSKLQDMYNHIIRKNLFQPYETYTHTKKSKIVIKTKWLYDSIVYHLEVITNGRVVNELRVLEISPIYIPAENPSISRDNYVRFPEVVGWIDDNTFKITCGHKEYNFLLDEMRVQVTEHEELKSKYVNWQSVH